MKKLQNGNSNFQLYLLGISEWNFMGPFQPAAFYLPHLNSQLQVLKLLELLERRL